MRIKFGKKVPEVQRQNILERDNYICQYCGEHATQLDHIIPRTNCFTTFYQKKRLCWIM